MDNADLQLEDHLHKCRCCFRLLVDDYKTVEINEAIEMKFFELTQIDVSGFKLI